MIAYPNISPVLVQLGPFALRWYGLAYAVSFYILSSIMRRESRSGFLPLSPLWVERLFLLLVLCILLGARIFYVLFYSTSMIWEAPSEILAMWHGGMSFHGGLFGIVVASYYVARKNKVPWASVVDSLALCGPIGITFGRIGNFINGELYGRITDVPWAIVFPNGGPNPRHPSQLYEALFEGVILGIILWTIKPRVKRYGVIAGVFFVGYGIARFMVEFVREPDVQLGFIWGPFTMGQILTFWVFVIGVIYLNYALKKGAPVKTAA